MKLCKVIEKCLFFMVMMVFLNSDFVLMCYSMFYLSQMKNKSFVVLVLERDGWKVCENTHKTHTSMQYKQTLNK